MNVGKIIAGTVAVISAGLFVFVVLLVREFFSWMDDMYWQNSDEEMEVTEDGIE